MKKTFLNTILIAGIIFSLNACSTPEERATVLKGADSMTAPASAPTDSLNSSLSKMNGDMDSSAATAKGDSTSNKKMESFRHTPIDTITNLSDSTKY